MHLKNEEETRKAIEKWHNSSPVAQLISLRKALESMELDQMHYEQKENSRGIERCGVCLNLLKQRITELEKS